jgi:NAD(P)H-quinone oxidoreductase subunit 5
MSQTLVGAMLGAIEQGPARGGLLEAVLHGLGLGVLGFPALLLAVLGLPLLLGYPLRERTMARWTQACVLGGLACALGVLALMLGSGTRHVPIELGHWVVLSQEHFHFHLKFVFDRLSVPMGILTFVLVGTIGAFAHQYLHREAGFRRFFVLYALFLLGMVSAVLAGTIEVLFVGWELVGLSSALLVAFFHERPAPVRNGMRVWSVYRVADASFLLAAVALHHLTGEGEFSQLMGQGPWPLGEAAMTSTQALVIGLFLLVAAAGKSALLPFSGWLPRAMEGPTPSSAVFYGALSVHLGTFLLLRVSPVLDRSPVLGGMVVGLGLLSAAYGALLARVQPDVKSALAYASLTQVGIITAEIGLGLRYLALVHILGHACLRTLQLVRAPNWLHDRHSLENAVGGHLPSAPGRWQTLLPRRAQLALYRLALDRGRLDALVDEWLAQPVLELFRTWNLWERRCLDALRGTASPPSDGPPLPLSLEEKRA